MQGTGGPGGGDCLSAGGKGEKRGDPEEKWESEEEEENLRRKGV